MTIQQAKRAKAGRLAFSFEEKSGTEAAPVSLGEVMRMSCMKVMMSVKLQLPSRSRRQR